LRWGFRRCRILVNPLLHLPRSRGRKGNETQSVRTVSVRTVSVRTVSVRTVSVRIVSVQTVSVRIVSIRIVSIRMVSVRIMSVRIVSIRNSFKLCLFQIHSKPCLFQFPSPRLGRVRVGLTWEHKSLRDRSSSGETDFDEPEAAHREIRLPGIRSTR